MNIENPLVFIVFSAMGASLDRQDGSFGGEKKSFALFWGGLGTSGALPFFLQGPLGPPREPRRPPKGYCEGSLWT